MTSTCTKKLKNSIKLIIPIRNSFRNTNNGLLRLIDFNPQLSLINVGSMMCYTHQIFNRYGSLCTRRSWSGVITKISHTDSFKGISKNVDTLNSRKFYARWR